MLLVGYIFRKAIMLQNDTYNTKLTKEPFGGTHFSVFSRKLCDENEKVMGSIRGKEIKDLNGKVIANLESQEKVAGEDGKNKKVSVYKSPDGDVFRVEGKTVFLNDSKIGSAKPLFATLENLFVMSIIFLLLATTALITIAALPFKIKPVVDIRDNNGDWGAQQNIVVFDKTLHPGTEGEYNFIVRNDNEVTLECVIEFIRANTNVEGDYFPLEFQLLMNNQVVGGYDWCSIEDIKLDNLWIMPHSDQAFCLRWRWLYENNQDENDTAFAINNGNIAISIKIEAQVK